LRRPARKKAVTASRAFQGGAVALGAMEGDVLEIVGKDTTVARAMLAYPEDEGLDVIRLDGLQRANAEVGSGEHVQVRKAESRPRSAWSSPRRSAMRLQGPGRRSSAISSAAR
jgi:transitional endoplasmic reticulum ATPase